MSPPPPPHVRFGNRRVIQIVIVSLAIHGALFLILSSESWNRRNETRDAPQATVEPVFLRLTPMPPARHPAAEAIRQPDDARPVEHAIIEPERRPPESIKETPPADARVDLAPPTDMPSSSDADLRARIALSLRTRGQRCDALTGEDRLRCDDARATRANDQSVGERSLTTVEARREEGFAEQARANEAWRNYRRSEDPGAYPGLRSLFRHF